MKVYPAIFHCGIHGSAAQIHRVENSSTVDLFAQMTECGDCRCRDLWTVSLADETLLSYFEALQKGIIHPFQGGQYPAGL